MYNNKLYNTRQSGRFNTPGNFVPAGEQQQAPQQPQQTYATRRQSQHQQNNVPVHTVEDIKNEQMETTDVDMTSKAAERPSWMRSNLPGVKKISNKERRRRQNENLRRLLSPKNALMVLNEMMPKAQVSNQFRVEPAAVANFYNARNSGNFCADLTLDGGSYKGYGENKLSARNAAAEQAFRDLIIARMNRLVADSAGAGGSQGGEEAEEDALPMIQLASFALHKLFTEWEYEGHKVPQLRPSASLSEDAPTDSTAPPVPGRKKAAAGPRVLPANAGAMHPCMLLTYMRPGLEYRELHVAGDKPQNICFTMGVDVDGQTFLGKAGNKKEARRQAAMSACTTLFEVTFEDKPLATKPELN